jgi:hypothetical protein
MVQLLLKSGASKSLAGRSGTPKEVPTPEHQSTTQPTPQRDSPFAFFQIAMSEHADNASLLALF